jgi:peptide/nickel transport system substrate-binding protein
MLVRRRVRLPVLAGLAIALLLAACSASRLSPPAAGTRVKGGMATIALAPGNNFNYILPLLSFDFATGANIEYSEYLMWRPLYWFGSPAGVGLNETYSLADPAVLTHVGATSTVATIQLKPYRWSDGRPVTSRDVEFWFNLLKAGKQIWWDYLPGLFPDNVTAFKIISASRFSLTFKGDFSVPWIYNELGQLIPVPQFAWDKESATGPVGNYDQTPSGAKAVYHFLAAQNKDRASYATNPLWQVVDGPWRLSQYAPATGDATYVRNLKYSGPATGSLHAIRVLAYTSDTAEFDSLLSTGGIDYGYLPFNDAADIGRVEADGYQVQAWPAWGITYITLNFASPQAGPLFKQLYIRQAMQHLINQAGYIDSFLGGYGNPTYGPVPLAPASNFVSAQQNQDPYPYDPGAAVTLLRGHGWQVVPNRTDSCLRPGTAANECGAGIAAGAKLALTLQYSTGVEGDDEEVAAFQSSLAQAGIKVALSGASFDTVVGDDVSCPTSGCWEMNYYGQGWYFDPGYDSPDGSVLFTTNAVDNGGLYSNAHADALMRSLPSGGLPALHAYENYLSAQLPVLWMPQFDYQISAVNDKLKGVLPQDPDDNIYPEQWYFVK